MMFFTEMGKNNSKICVIIFLIICVFHKRPERSLEEEQSSASYFLLYHRAFAIKASYMALAQKRIQSSGTE